MYNFDFTPLVWAFGAFIGGLAGLIIAALAWIFAPLGWWTFAIPVALSLVGGGLLVRSAK